MSYAAPDWYYILSGIVLVCVLAYFLITAYLLWRGR